MVWIPKEPKYKPKPPKPNNIPTNTPTNTPMNREEAMRGRMNRDEAIKILSSYDVNGVWADVDGKPYNAEEQAEAFDMAIEALQTDIVRCGSCIHGQKILKAKEDVACDIWGGIWTENGFCSCGERREENGKANETGRGNRSY